MKKLIDTKVSFPAVLKAIYTTRRGLRITADVPVSVVARSGWGMSWVLKPHQLLLLQTKSRDA